MEIIIKGKAGEGKTTLALYLKVVLEALGMKVSVDDYDITNKSYLPEYQSARLALLENKEILVKTQQCRKLKPVTVIDHQETIDSLNSTISNLEATVRWLQKNLNILRY